VRRSIKVAEANPDHVFHVKYDTLIKNPLDTMKKIYTFFGLDGWNAEVENSMKKFLDDNKQHKHGKHYYSLAQYGLTKEDVRREFAEYYAKFLDSDEITNLDTQLGKKRLQ